MKLLTIAAWEPELEHLRGLDLQKLSSLFQATPSDATNALTLNMDAVGIGPVDAAVGVTQCISKYGPDRVLLLGTCGAAPTSTLAIGDVILGSHALLVDPATVEGRAALPYGTTPIILDSSMAEHFQSAGATPSKVVCPLGITTDDALAARLAPLGDVEHLEAYAVARACELASIPCAVVLGIANVVGSKGREQWRAHHLAASARAAGVAYAALTEMAMRRSSEPGSLKTSTKSRSPA